MKSLFDSTTLLAKNLGGGFCLGLLFTAMIFLGENAHADEKNLQKTVASILAVYGGKEKLAAVKSIAAHGRIDDFLRKVSGGYARSMRRPGQLRIDIRPEQGGEVRILNQDKGWQGSGNTLSAAKPLSLSSMRYQYGYLDLPMSLADETAKAQYQGIRELHGRPMAVLLIDLEAAPELTVYVDLETHLIRRVEATFTMGEMGSSLLGTEYADFRTVGGLVFPFKLNNFAGGNNISTISLVRLMLDQALPQKVFPAN